MALKVALGLGPILKLTWLSVKAAIAQVAEDRRLFGFGDGRIGIGGRVEVDHERQGLLVVAQHHVELAGRSEPELIDEPSK